MYEAQVSGRWKRPLSTLHGETKALLYPSIRPHEGGRTKDPECKLSHCYVFPLSASSSMATALVTAKFLFQVSKTFGEAPSENGQFLTKRDIKAVYNIGFACSSSYTYLPKPSHDLASRCGLFFFIGEHTFFELVLQSSSFLIFFFCLWLDCMMFHFSEMTILSQKGCHAELGKCAVEMEVHPNI